MSARKARCQALDACEAARAPAASASKATAVQSGLAHRDGCGEPLTVSEAITGGRRAQRSRGAQFREDFPDRIALRSGEHHRPQGRGRHDAVAQEALRPMPAELKAIIEEMK
jgi:hypothetical protein